MKPPFAFTILAVMTLALFATKAESQTCYVNSRGQTVCSGYASPVRNFVSNTASRVVYAQPARRVVTRLQSARPILRPFARSYSYSTPSTASVSYGSAGSVQSYGSSGGYTTSATSYSEPAATTSTSTTASGGCDCAERWEALEERLEALESRRATGAPAPPTSQRAIKNESLLANLRRIESGRGLVAVR